MVTLEVVPERLSDVVRTRATMAYLLVANSATSVAQALPMGSFQIFTSRAARRIGMQRVAGRRTWALACCQSTLLLTLYIGVLWRLSRGMFLPFPGFKFANPGLLYASARVLCELARACPLIALDADHYALEAELPFGLVRVSEEIEGLALYGGEAGEKRRLDVLLNGGRKPSNERLLDLSFSVRRSAISGELLALSAGWGATRQPLADPARSPL